MNRYTVSGPGFDRLLESLAKENRRVLSMSRGKTNAEWIVEASPAPVPAQGEFSFQESHLQAGVCSTHFDERRKGMPLEAHQVCPNGTPTH